MSADVRDTIAGLLLRKLFPREREDLDALRGVLDRYGALTGKQAARLRAIAGSTLLERYESRAVPVDDDSIGAEFAGQRRRQRNRRAHP